MVNFQETTSTQHMRVHLIQARYQNQTAFNVLYDPVAHYTTLQYCDQTRNVFSPHKTKTDAYFV